MYKNIYIFNIPYDHFTKHNTYTPNLHCVWPAPIVFYCVVNLQRPFSGLSIFGIFTDFKHRFLFSVWTNLLEILNIHSLVYCRGNRVSDFLISFSFLRYGLSKIKTIADLGMAWNLSLSYSIIFDTGRISKKWDTVPSGISSSTWLRKKI